MKQLKTFLVLGAILFSGAGRAQITVGINENPETGAALELKNRTSVLTPVTPADLENADKGLLFPKVMLLKYDSLAPLYPPTATPAQKAKATGMVVYNVNENAFGVDIGLNQWNGTMWTSLSKGNGVAMFNCLPGDPATVNGYYTKGVSLSSISNTVVLPVNVTKPGIYSIQGIVYEGNSSVEATFSFFGSGEFRNTGLQQVILLGQGRPALSTAENSGVANRLKIIANGKELTCTFPSIHVGNVLPNYSFNCNSVRVYYPGGGASLKKGLLLNNSTNEVEIEVKVTSTSPMAEYHIETDSVNGMRFVADGQLTAGSNTIPLYGRGTPLKSGTYTFTITGNNANLSAVCSANINVAYDRLRVLIAGDLTGAWGLGSSMPNAAIRRILSNPAIFDLDQNPNAPFHAAAGSIEITNIAGTSITSASTINSFNNYDVIFISYLSTPNAAAATALCDYVKSGKTVLLTCDDWDNSKVRMSEIINNLSGLNNSTSNYYIGTTAQGDDTFNFISGNLAVNGQYKDLTGEKLGRDGGGNFLFQNLPSDWIVVASNSTTDPRNNAKLIMHKKYRMFLSGDGGIFTGGCCGYAADAGYHAASVDTNGNPIAATHLPFGSGTSAGHVWNSAFLANLLIWAFEAANAE